MYYFSRAICGLKTKAGHTKYRRIPNENIQTISFNCYPNSMWVNQFGNYSLLKSSVFSKCSKMLKIGQFCQWQNVSFRIFFSKLCRLETIEIFTLNHSHIEAQSPKIFAHAKSLLIPWLVIEKIKFEKWILIAQNFCRSDRQSSVLRTLCPHHSMA